MVDVDSSYQKAPLNKGLLSNLGEIFIFMVLSGQLESAVDSLSS